MITCFMAGHSDAPQALREKLAEAVEDAIIRYGVTRFVVGQYGAFDAMAAGAVLRAKKTHPAVSLYLLLPYHPAERPVCTPEGFDGTLYPFETPVPRRLAIVKANQKMVECSDCLIFYAAHPGNAKNLLMYARQRAGNTPLLLL